MAVALAAPLIAHIGPGAGAIALSIGATLLDRMFIMPALAGKPNQPRPTRELGVPMTTASPGSPRVYALGRRVRVPTHIMFSSEMVRDSLSPAGKGGAQARTQVRQVHRDVGVVVNDRHTNRLLQLITNGRLVYFTNRNLIAVQTHNWTATAIAGGIRIDMASVFETDLSHKFQAMIKAGGTSSGGNTSTTLNDTSKSYVTNEHAGRSVRILSGTGAGQVRPIGSNTGTQLVLATLYPWAVTPDSTSVYEIEGAGDHVRLRGWLPASQDGYWQVYSVTPHTGNTPSSMVLRNRGNQTPANATGGTALAPASIERLDDAVVNSEMTATLLGSGIVKVTSTFVDFGAVFNPGDVVVPQGWSTGLAGGTMTVIQTTEQALNPGGKVYTMNLQAVGWTPTNSPYTAGTFNNAARLVWDTNTRFLTTVMNDAQFMQGRDDEGENSILAQHLTSGTIPGFRGVAWLAMDQFNVTEFGNAPAIYEAIVEPDSGLTVAQAIQEVYLRSGFGVDTIDVSGIDDRQMTGLYLRGPAPIVQQLQPLLLAHQIVTQDRGGVVHFFDISNAPSVQIVNGAQRSDMGARLERGEAVRKSKSIQVADHDLPTSVGVRFQDIDNACAENYEHVGLRNPSGVDHSSIEDLDLSQMTMSRAEARNLATTVMRRTWVNSDGHEVPLTASYVHLLENDLLTWTDDDDDVQTGRVVRVGSLGEDMLVRATVVNEDVALAVAGSPAQAATGVPPPVLYPPAEHAIGILDIPPLFDAQMGAPGLYLCAGPKNGGVWAGLRVYQSLDGGSNYDLIATLDSPHLIGTAETALADGTASEEAGNPTVTWDTGSSVDVLLDSTGPFGGLASASSSQVKDQGFNWALLGDEIIAFQTVTQTGANRYTLSNMLRGLRKTVTTGHVSGERFVFLTGFFASGRFLPFAGGARVGQTVHLKFVPPGRSLSEVTATSITLEGWNARPLPPYDFSSETDGGTNDVTFTVTTPNTRRNVGVAAQPPLPFDESFEEYVWRVYSNSGYSTVVATLTRTSRGGAGGTGTPRVRDREIIYTAAEQTADGLTPGATLYYDVRHIGDNGASRAVRATT